MSTLRKLAYNASSLEYEKITPEVLLWARYALLDTIGCAVFGSVLPEGRAITKTLKNINGPGISPVWGTDIKLSVDNCALACGSLSHLRELDDVHYSIVHPGSVCVPAAMSAAYANKAKLSDLLTAIISGYEVMIRIAKGINYFHHRQRGWHATASCGPFGAAAAVAKLLALNSEQFVWALGLAGSRTGGTWAFSADGAMSKRLHPGLAARDGVLSAYMAKSGITGPSHVLEAKDGGFYQATSQDWDLGELTLNWGESFAISEIEFKLYAACKSVHAPLEAARNIFARSTRHIDDVKSVIVEVNSSGVAMAGRMYDPHSVISAQLSIPYGVAIALMGGKGDATDFMEDKLSDTKVFELAQKVKVVASEELNKLRLKEHKSGAKVRVIWVDGSEDRERVETPKGSIYNPASREELEQKFLSLSAPILGDATTEQLRDVILYGDYDYRVNALCLSPNATINN